MEAELFHFLQFYYGLGWEISHLSCRIFQSLPMVSVVGLNSTGFASLTFLPRQTLGDFSSILLKHPIPADGISG